jgi:hypothetical protein
MMRTFYLYRIEDVHGNSGCGCVAEGVIFDTGRVAMTWLSRYPTMTMFESIKDVHALHSHAGRTLTVVEGECDPELYQACRREAELKPSAWAL